MAEFDRHERLYRGAESAERPARPRSSICGAGAIGSHLADGLARAGARRLHLIDRDRVAEGNLGTQVYTRDDIGALKTEALRNHLFRAVGVEAEGTAKELTAANAARLLAGADLVVDAFDHRAARAAVAKYVRAAGGTGVACLHVGLSATGFAEVRWDARYAVPTGVGEDACDVPLARNLVVLAAAVAAEAVLRYLVTGATEDWTVTLGDLAVLRAE
ncbi:MAG: ThiF family adenylyltransferase [Planctomycetes bacterium]|nr:ThiF family adenylyltransferase [Planctomycetota bacterium]